MRWILCRRLPLGLSVAAAACTPPSSTGGSSTGTEGDATSSASGTGDATTSSMTTQTSAGTGTGTGTGTSNADTDSGGDTTMGPGATDDADSSGGSGSTGERAECPPTHACVDVAPMGWNGPVAFEVGDELGSLQECNGPFPTELLSTNVDPTAPAPDCQCDCAGGPLTCDDVTVGTCGGPLNLLVGSSGGGSCLTGNPVGSAGDWTAGSQISGSCTSVQTETIDPVSFAGALRACAGPTIDEGCRPGQACNPLPTAPFSGTLCIYAEGDVECPAGSQYTQRTFYMTDFEDTRDCGPCSCAPVEGVCDVAGDVTLYEQGFCILGSGVGILPPDGSCGPMSFNGSPISTPESFFVAVPTVPADACEDLAMGGGPEGEIGDFTPIDPVTVCCRP